MDFILPSMLALPVFAILAIMLGSPPRGTALLATGTSLLLSLFLAFQFPVGEAGYHFQFMRACLKIDAFNLSPGSIPPSINLHFGIDGINLVMLLMTTLVSCAAVALSDAKIHRAREYFICMLLVSMGALGAFVSLDLFMLYLFHEIALIPTFILIGVWGSGHRQRSATLMTIYLGVASLILLAGLIGVYALMSSRISSLDFTELHRSIVPKGLAGLPSYLLVFGGLSILAALWPFHSWAPAGYTSAPPPVAMLHAGLLKKLAIYLLLRLSIVLLPQGTAPYLNLLFWLLLGNLLYIGWVALRQKDLSFLVSFSSVMHIGYLFLGLASLISVAAVSQRQSFFTLSFLTELSSILIAGIVLLTMAHGLGTALLFALSGEIKRRTGTLELDQLGGLAASMPRLCTFFMIAALAAIGLPMLASFPGELLILIGSWQVAPIFTAAALFGIVLSAIYMLRAVRMIFFGPLHHSAGAAPDLKGLREFWPHFILTAPLILFGVYPQLIVNWIRPAIRGLLGN